MYLPVISVLAAREIGFLYGMYKKLARENTGVLTGKGLELGRQPDPSGSYRIRSCLFCKGNAEDQKEYTFKGKIVAISGFGNVAWGAAQKATELGAKVVTISAVLMVIFTIRMAFPARKSNTCSNSGLPTRIL